MAGENDQANNQQAKSPDNGNWHDNQGTVYPAPLSVSPILKELTDIGTTVLSPEVKDALANVPAEVKEAIGAVLRSAENPKDVDVLRSYAETLGKNNPQAAGAYTDLAEQLISHKNDPLRLVLDISQATGPEGGKLMSDLGAQMPGIMKSVDESGVDMSKLDPKNLLLPENLLSPNPDTTKLLDKVVSSPSMHRAEEDVRRLLDAFVENAGMVPTAKGGEVDIRELMKDKVGGPAGDERLPLPPLPQIKEVPGAVKKGMGGPGA